MRLESEINELRRQKHHFLQDMRKTIQLHLEMVSFEEAGGEASRKPAG